MGGKVQNIAVDKYMAYLATRVEMTVKSFRNFVMYFNGINVTYIYVLVVQSDPFRQVVREVIELLRRFSLLAL